LFFFRIRNIDTNIAELNNRKTKYRLSKTPKYVYLTLVWLKTK